MDLVFLLENLSFDMNSKNKLLFSPNSERLNTQKKKNLKLKLKAKNIRKLSQYMGQNSSWAQPLVLLVRWVDPYKWAFLVYVNMLCMN